MAGYAAGTPQYYAKYRQDAEAAVRILTVAGADVYLVSAPPAATAEQSMNLTEINQMYAALGPWRTPGSPSSMLGVGAHG